MLEFIAYFFMYYILFSAYAFVIGTVVNFAVSKYITWSFNRVTRAQLAERGIV